MSGKKTELVVSTRGAKGKPVITRWAWGHVAAERQGNEVWLVVSGDEDESSSVESPALLPAQALAAGDCLRAAAGNAPKSMCAGKSIHEMLWDELMVIVERLMTGAEAEDGKDPGRAEGVAYAIAIFTNPYAPNIESVREEAMARWEDQDEPDNEEADRVAVQERKSRRADMRARRRARQ